MGKAKNYHSILSVVKAEKRSVKTDTDHLMKEIY